MHLFAKVFVKKADKDLRARRPACRDIPFKGATMSYTVRNISLAAASIAAVASLIFNAGPALAAPQGQGYVPPTLPGPQRRAELRQRGRKPDSTLVGRVKAVNGSDIVLDRPALKQQTTGQLIVQTNASTVFYTTAAGGTLADIKAGDRVAILTAAPAAGAPAAGAERNVIAQAVSVLPAPERVLMRGEVSNPGASGFTLNVQRAQRTSTITVSATTKIVIAGKTGATMADIKAGDKVVAHGQLAGAGVINADLIVVRPASRDNVAGGVLASVSGKTLVIFTRDGRQLKVDAASALVYKHGATAASLADLHVGRPVGVLGVKNADGTMTAQLIGQPNLIP